MEVMHYVYIKEILFDIRVVKVVFKGVEEVSVSDPFSSRAALLVEEGGRSAAVAGISDHCEIFEFIVHVRHLQPLRERRGIFTGETVVIINDALPFIWKST